MSSGNRIPATAIRLRIEPILNAWIDSDQRGFLPARSLLSNAIDIEEWMIHTAAAQREGAAVFVDFRAAFPPIAHDCLLEVARDLGIPDRIMILIRVSTRTASVRSSLAPGGTQGFGYQQESARAAHSRLCYSHWWATSGFAD